MTHWLTMPVDCKKDMALKHGTVYRCRACSYGALLPRPDPAALRGAYELELCYPHGASHVASAQGGPVSKNDEIKFDSDGIVAARPCI
jgi:hypothetical protein